MDAPSELVRLAGPWGRLHSSSKGLEIFVTFLHVGGLLLAADSPSQPIARRYGRFGRRFTIAYSDRAWTHLHNTAEVSLVLWYAITLAGIALLNVG